MNNNGNYPSFEILNQLPGCWGCKDINSVFVYVNDEYSRIIGFNNPLDCIGLTDFDIPHLNPKYAHLFQQQDLQVIQSEKQLRILDIHPYADGYWRAHLFTKTAWRDNNNNVIGVIFSGVELKHTSLLEIGHWICRSNTTQYHEKNTFNQQVNIFLNTRESEVLFLLLYGKKPQYISKTLQLAVKTVENYVVRLREKFNANSKGELIELALDAGFGSHIPESMLKTQQSIILTEY
ncbi:helix-turn-helix transcriptional regulator [Photobacterium phosphoreum]|jgi:DNA-binding CsgD family transcriptional regulator|uniref:helix-turn-helix transcriptional regulator n=1 Tax=Photobacterium phosphoreum TaxID=659 RepID=UPI0007F8A41A|nr:helix-turn-helix transcriptional regulator [Photobacterium phosphoreum]MCD9469238.1 LuxR family transcriptional regulator [Photobacterium phosphoreum]MCD9477743.1 PAS domain-containing protein [Photobacterium phosphoreum]MCD9481936.1 PAS domain-containing protein [Photobacterium phosphoreum]MCD9503810.1 PAS domain-containing protein [Photobacterium phosphoreum]MCD9505544.1 PAS domain-containing protein [Photobacterium phosphoreum]